MVVLGRGECPGYRARHATIPDAHGRPQQDQALARRHPAAAARRRGELLLRPRQTTAADPTDQPDAPSSVTTPATTTPPAQNPAPPPAPRGPGFRSQRALDQHFEKHGHEFDCRSAAEYLALAQRLRDRAAGPNLLEVVRKDGVISRFDRDSGAFLAFNRDRTIRTLFVPNDGERYFRRQAERDD